MTIEIASFQKQFTQYLSYSMSLYLISSKKLAVYQQKYDPNGVEHKTTLSRYSLEAFTDRH